MWVANVQQTADCHTLGEFLDYMDVDVTGFCPYMQTFLPIDFEVGLALARRDMYLIGMFYCREGIAVKQMNELRRFTHFAKQLNECMHADGRAEYAPDIDAYLDEFEQVYEKFREDERRI